MFWNVQQTPHATEVSNLALNYLCKLAGCTLNVQPVNLHKFFSHCKARHDLSAYTKSKGKTCQQFELLLLPKLIILNQEYPFLYFLKILTGHLEKKKRIESLLNLVNNSWLLGKFQTMAVVLTFQTHFQTSLKRLRGYCLGSQNIAKKY